MDDDVHQQFFRNCESPVLFRCDAVELGKGRYGVVFVGYLQGVKVAVKKIRVEFGSERNEAAMLKMDHPNVIKLFHVEDESSFRYLALELCAATLQNYCDKTYCGPMPGQLDSMIQMSSGLCHIHSKHLVHGDIKPENILISFPDSSSRVVLKISEYGLCKIAPKSIYVAPELMGCLSMDKNVYKISTSSSDTYALGYSFLEFLNRGSHSDQGYWIDELRCDIPVLDLINRMTCSEAELRPDMSEVLNELLSLRPTAAPKISCSTRCCEVQTGWVSACSFHPWKPKLACSTEQGIVCLFTGLSHTTPFAEWCSTTLNSGIEDWITTVAWNAKGTKLAAGCGDGTVVVWEEDGEETFRVRLHKNRINCLSWNKRDAVVSHLFVTGSDDNLALIWNATNGSTHRFKGHTSAIRQVVWISSHQFASLDDTTINIWHWDLQEPITTFHHQVPMRWMHWIPESQRLAMCCADGTFTVYQLNKALAQKLRYPKDPVSCFDLHRSLLMACGSWDSNVSVWDLETSDVPRILTGHTGWILVVLFSPDGKNLATADVDKLVCIWSTLTWQLLFKVRVPFVEKNCLTWDSFSRKLAVANQSNRVWLVELEYQEES